MPRAPRAPRLLALLGLAACGPTDRPAEPRPGAPAGSVAAAPPPPSAPDAPAEPAQIVFGEAHGCALLGDGTVRCWGENALGQLGRPSDGSAIALGPAEVPGLAGVVQIAARSDATCALGADGQVLCWGAREWGGRPKPGDKAHAPAAVEGLGAARSVALGQSYGCAARRTGEVVCWGSNHSGQVSPGGPSKADPAPRAVAGLSGAVQVAAGSTFACARLEAGGVRCWGGNGQGELGDGTTEERKAPVAVAGVDDAVDLSASRDHACVARRSGRVTCWGANNIGQLGGEGREVKNGPVTYAALDDATQVSAGSDLTCARRRGGTVRCWGSASQGQTGTGATGLDPGAKHVAADAAGVEGAAAVGAAQYTACALRGRDLLCWGANAHGLLGNGSASEVRRPAPVPLAGPAADVVAGRGASCALLKDGRVQCWGEGFASARKRPGEARKPSLALPEFVAGLEGVRSLLTRDGHLCAYRGREPDPLCLLMGVFPYASGPGPDEALRRPLSAKGLGRLTSMTREPLGGAWALATRAGGQLVAFTLEQKPQAGGGHWLEAKVQPFKGAPALARVAGGRAGGEPYYCALSKGAGKKVGCFSAKGKGSFDPPELVGRPEPVAGLHDAIDLAVWRDRACAVRARGEVVCWQRPEAPPDGAPAAVAPRAVAGLEAASRVAFDTSTGNNVCALGKGGKVYCWSDFPNDARGLLCTGSRTQKAPAACPGVDDGVRLSMGYGHACVLRKGGGVSCWGDNLTGAVGPVGVAGSEAPVATPL